MSIPPSPCERICLPYFQEIANLTIAEVPMPKLDWRPEPDQQNPFPPFGHYLCPHQVRWTAQPTREQVQEWEALYPLQPEVFPAPFVCGIVTDLNADPCTHEVPPDLFIGEPLEVPLAQMLEHAQKAHGAPFFGAISHLVQHYPGLQNYAGTRARIEAYEARVAAQQ